VAEESERAAELGISPQKIEPQSEANEGSVGLAVGWG